MIVIICLTIRAWGTCRAALTGDVPLLTEEAFRVVVIGIETGLAGITATTTY